MSWEDIIKDTSFKSLEQMITLWTYDRDAFRMIESRHGRGIFANDFQEWLRALCYLP